CGLPRLGGLVGRAGAGPAGTAGPGRPTPGGIRISAAGAGRVAGVGGVGSPEPRRRVGPGAGARPAAGTGLPARPQAGNRPARFLTLLQPSIPGTLPGGEGSDSSAAPVDARVDRQGPDPGSRHQTLCGPDVRLLPGPSGGHDGMPQPAPASPG